MKKHFKMYKNGKRWCVVAIATISLGLGISLGSIAHADMMPNNETPATDTLTTGTPTNTILYKVIIVLALILKVIIRRRLSLKQLKIKM